jgi:hypothetical protein
MPSRATPPLKILSLGMVHTRLALGSGSVGPVPPSDPPEQPMSVAAAADAISLESLGIPWITSPGRELFRIGLREPPREVACCRNVG